MSKTRFISIRNQAESTTLELFFLDVIQDTYDWWTGMMVSQVQQVIDKINYYKPNKIKVIIDSVGGDAPTGLAIYNFLKRYDAKVEVEVIGLAGSIASVIAMAANKGKLRIAKNAFMMIHRCEGVAVGSSDDIRAGADLIDMYTDQAVDIYSQRTGKSKEEIAALFADGDYWMTGDQAVEQGFADEMFNDVSDNLQIAARLDTSLYKNIPQEIRAQLKPTNEAPDQEDNKNFIEQQFEDMKKFFSDLGVSIMNSLKGVKAPEGNNHETLMASIGTAVSQSFDAQSAAMENAVEEVVTNKLKEDKVKEEISNQVSEVLNKIDFTKDGAPKTAIENAAKLVIENALAADGENPIKAAFDKAVAERVTEKTKDLETEITNLKGKPTNSGNSGTEPKVIGSFKKG